MFGSMFETAAYHRGLQWPPSAASACGYSMPTFDASSSRLASSVVRDVVPHGHAPQSAAGYPSLVDHGRYAAAAPAPLYDGRSTVRDVLFGCGRFSDPATGSSALHAGGVSDDGRQPSSAPAFSPLSLPCVGPDGVPASTGAVADCPPPPPPRLPATPYGYGATPTDDRYYSTGNGVGGSTAVLPGDVQSVGCGQPTAGFRSPALGLGFNPRRFVNDVIGEYFSLSKTFNRAYKKERLCFVTAVLLT